jgi:RecA/RadA recombinase
MFDLDAILGDVKKLYAKDKKSQSMIVSGNTAVREYGPEDGFALSEGNMIRELLEVPVFPHNKIIQFAGNPDTGKSTASATTVVDAQKAGYVTIVWDAEDKFDMARLVKLGGDPAKTLLVKTNEILQGGEKVRKLVVATKARYPEAKILIVWDSVGGSQSRSHAERELDDVKNGQPGQDAKENASVMRMLVGMFNKFPDSICVYLANQVYAKIGMFQFGDAQSGGKKVEFHSSAIIVLKRVKKLTKTVDGIEKKFGIVTCASVHKNHLSSNDMSIDELYFKITARGCAVTKNPFEKKKKAADVVEDA